MALFLDVVCADARPPNRPQPIPKHRIVHPKLESFLLLLEPYAPQLCTYRARAAINHNLDPVNAETLPNTSAALSQYDHEGGQPFGSNLRMQILLGLSLPDNESFADILEGLTDELTTAQMKIFPSTVQLEDPELVCWIQFSHQAHLDHPDLTTSFRNLLCTPLVLASRAIVGLGQLPAHSSPSAPNRSSTKGPARRSITAVHLYMEAHQKNRVHSLLYLLYSSQSLANLCPGHLAWQPIPHRDKTLSADHFQHAITLMTRHDEWTYQMITHCLPSPSLPTLAIHIPIPGYDNVRLYDLLMEITVRTKLAPDKSSIRVVSPAQIDALEAIDRERTSATLSAEHQCWKIRAGDIPWTPNFASARHRLTYYKLSLQRICGHPVDAHTVHRATKRAKISATPLSEADALERFRLARCLYKDAKAQSTKAKCTSFLEGLAAARAAAGDTNAVTELCQLITQEEQRARFRTIKVLHNPDRRCGLDYITTRQLDGSTKECTTKADIESACLAENDSHFSQSLSTPFLSQPLLGVFGLLGNSTVSARVVSGTYMPPTGTDPHACPLLPFFRKGDHVQDFSMNITHNKFVQSWHRACKRTAGGLSRLHFGHFKALLDAESPDLIDLEVAILNIVVRSGYVLSWWHVGLNVMLLKKQGVYGVTSCCTNLLYEPDFNNLLKILGRQTMLNAEKFHVLAPEQYGSRKSLTSIRQALNKVLTYDLIHQCRIPAAMCSNDAKSCYERIIHSVAKLALLRCGAPEPTVDLMFNAIRRLRHHIRTAFGDSTMSYGGNHKPPQAWSRPRQQSRARDMGHPQHPCSGSTLFPGHWL
jgi:hypothetical protein